MIDAHTNRARPKATPNDFRLKSNTSSATKRANVSAITGCWASWNFTWPTACTWAGRTRLKSSICLGRRFISCPGGGLAGGPLAGTLLDDIKHLAVLLSGPRHAGPFWKQPAGALRGLALIAIGAGGIKPCVAAFVGDQFKPSQHHLLTIIYGWFYWVINLGAAAAFFIIPQVHIHWGYSWAFGIPGLAMGLATFIFWLGRRQYVRQPPERQAPRTPEKPPPTAQPCAASPWCLFPSRFFGRFTTRSIRLGCCKDRK